MNERRKVWFLATIQKCETGETVVDRYQTEEDDPESQRFWWEDGNAACDCNRAHFFARARGEENPDEPCGSERYRLVSLVNEETGEVIYSEPSQ